VHKPTISPQQARNKPATKPLPRAIQGFSSSPRRLPLDRCNAANVPLLYIAAGAKSVKPRRQPLRDSATLRRSFSTLISDSDLRSSSRHNAQLAYLMCSPYTVDTVRIMLCICSSAGKATTRGVLIFVDSTNTT